MTASTTFVDGTTVIRSAWLNAVNDSIFGAFVSLKRYNPAMDGTTDDSPAWAAACAEIVARGGTGTILVPSGTSAIANETKIGDAVGNTVTCISLQAEGLLGAKVKYTGATNGVCFKWWRNKFSSCKGLQFVNGVAKGTTVGLMVTGPNAGTQCNNLHFEQCSFSGFDVGFQAGGGPLGTECCSEVNIIGCTFSLNNSGFFGAGSGNTINIWFRGSVFTQNTNYGADFGTAGACHVFGGATNGNGTASIHCNGQWQLTTIVDCVRFELGATETAVALGTGANCTISHCQFVTTSTVPTNAIITGSTLHTRIIGCDVGSVGDVGWKVWGGNTVQNGLNKTLYMEGNRIYGTVPFYIDSGDTGIDALNYTLVGNTWNGARQPDEIGKVVHPNRVSDTVTGSATFATAGTKAVTFTTRENATYNVALSGSASETIWVSSKGTGGFTLNSSNASSTATVDWRITR